MRKTPRQTIIEIPYIMERLSKSSALMHLVTAFTSAVNMLDYSPDINEINNREISSANPQQNNFRSPEEEEEEEDLTLYGLPPKPGSEIITATKKQSSLRSSSKDDAFFSSSSSSKKMEKVLLRELTQSFLDLFLDISLHEECSIVICEQGVCDAAINMIDKDFAYDNKDLRLSYTVELMWNVLEYFVSKMKGYHGLPDYDELVLLIKHGGIMDLEHSMKVLFQLLDYQINEGYKQSDKEFRNMILIVLSIYAEFPNTIGYFLNSQLFHWLITYACVEEIGKNNWMFFLKKTAKKRNFISTIDVDLEFKKQVWILITQLLRSNDPDALLCVAASPLMTALLMYLETDSPTDNNATSMKKVSTTNSNNNNHHMMTENQVGFSHSSSLSYDDGGGTGGGGGGGGGGLVSKSLTNENSAIVNNKKDLKNVIQQQKNSNKLLTMNQTTTSSHSQLTANGFSLEKPFISTLTPSKLREFQVQAMLFLLQNAPKILTEFERMDGIARIIRIIQHYCASENVEHQQLIFYALVLIHRSLLNSIQTREYLESINGVSIFLDIFTHCCSTCEESRAQILRIVSSLCNHHNRLCQDQFQSHRGILLLLEPLRLYIKKRPALIGLKAGLNIQHDQHRNNDGHEKGIITDPYEDAMTGEISVLVISIIDCFKAAIVSYRENELQFADLEGMDVLLDLLEISPFVLRLHVMRILTDILKNCKVVPFANCWRSGKTLRSAAQVLCHAYLDEEARLNFERKTGEFTGIICNILEPLGNHQWPISDTEAPLLGFHNDGFHNTFSTSLAVTKLTTAILAGRAAVQTNLPVKICNEAMETDARSLLSELLGSLGLYESYHIRDEFNPFRIDTSQSILRHEEEPIFEEGIGSFSVVKDNSIMNPSKRSPGSRAASISDIKKYQQQHHTDQPNEGGNAFDEVRLGAREKQVLAVAKKYLALKEGEWWKDVKKNLEEKKIVPIEADAALISARLDNAFDAAIATQVEQMILSDEQEVDKKAEEDGFLGQILTKKHQQIKAEWLKRNAKGVPAKKVKTKVTK
jgi:hypothetical protein